MEYKEIKQILEDMENTQFTSIDIEFSDGTKISVKKEINARSTENSKNEKLCYERDTIQKDKMIIKSPMVGTFYINKQLTSKPYIEIGKEIKKGDTVCIIEAMKLMNEIESEFSGKISEIYVKDGDPVQYGTPLMRLE